MHHDNVIEALCADMQRRGNGLPPASEPAVRAAEQAMGLTIPPALRRVYLEIANGGFGPGYGAQSMPGGQPHGDWSNVVEAWQSLNSSPDIRFPTWLLPLTDWGCAIWSLVDCRDETGYVWGLDPNGGIESALFWTEQPVVDWLTASLRDEVQRPNSARRPRKARRAWNLLGERSLPEP